tara:strand:+ start:437 stop:595 length:159 start_codon:yes stop_codon:yes gene_type:complete
MGGIIMSDMEYGWGLFIRACTQINPDTDRKKDVLQKIKDKAIETLENYPKEI